MICYLKNKLQKWSNTFLGKKPFQSLHTQFFTVTKQQFQRYHSFLCFNYILQRCLCRYFELPVVFFFHTGNVKVPTRVFSRTSCTLTILKKSHVNGVLVASNKPVHNMVYSLHIGNWLIQYNKLLPRDLVLLKLLSYVSVQEKTDLMSENKFLRYELLKLEVPFLPPNWWERGVFSLVWRFNYIIPQKWTKSNFEQHL